MNRKGEMMKKALMYIALVAMMAGACTTVFAEMILVEGGTFMMGSKAGDDDEMPVHEVTLTSFMISKFELTLGEFYNFVEDTGYKTVAEIAEPASDWDWRHPGFTQTDPHPVTCIAWYDAIEYCNWRSRQEGLTPAYTIVKTRKDPKNQDADDDLKWLVSCDWTANGYRLPTEAEWEFAARGGNNSLKYRYSGGNDINKVAWNTNNSKSRTHKTGIKSPNELGIYDMTGNVWEWCWDRYGDYPGGRGTDPKGAEDGSNRVIRGGSLYDGEVYSRVYNRDNVNPGFKSPLGGVRLVKAIQ